MMGAIAVSHFQQLLAPQTQLTEPISPIWIHGLTNFRCSPDISTSMSVFPSPEEIRCVLFRLNIFKDSWQTLGAEMIRSTQTFFVHAQQYQKQQGNSTAILTRSCKFGTLDPQGSALLIDRQQHLCVARFRSTTVDPNTSPVDRYSLTTVDQRHSPSVDRHHSSDIDRYSIPDIDRY
ncbi:hypothetical protein DY000_02006634 [Brassica cretica]|uniref:Uncharacterized protein n=1 Tax=Brassica cretica TaxID=69181 RepID=A0ABQ7CDB4_BRACR|nr:hypothetical protein DY000_02006634 [Brassica cretica]